MCFINSKHHSNIIVPNVYGAILQKGHLLTYMNFNNLIFFYIIYIIVYYSACNEINGMHGFPITVYVLQFFMHYSAIYITVYSIYMHKCFQETLHSHEFESKKDQLNESLIEHLADPEDLVEQTLSSTTNKSILKNWPLMSAIVLFCIVSFDDMAYTEVC